MVVIGVKKREKGSNRKNSKDCLLMNIVYTHAMRSRKIFTKNNKAMKVIRVEGDKKGMLVPPA